MNNQPLVEAYKSFYEQGREKLAAGDYSGAREAFLKAADTRPNASFALRLPARRESPVFLGRQPRQEEVDPDA